MAVTYDLTMKAILLFMIAVNVSLFWITASGVLPIDFTTAGNPDSPVANPTDIQSMILSVDTSTGNLILGGTALVISAIIGWIAGNLVLGGSVGVILFAITLFSPIVRWILFGLPQFMNLMGVPSYISAGIMALLVVPLFYTVLSMLTNRPVEGHG